MEPKYFYHYYFNKIALNGCFRYEDIDLLLGTDEILDTYLDKHYLDSESEKPLIRNQLEKDVNDFRGLMPNLMVINLWTLFESMLNNTAEKLKEKKYEINVDRVTRGELKSRLIQFERLVDKEIVINRKAVYKVRKLQKIRNKISHEGVYYKDESFYNLTNTEGDYFYTHQISKVIFDLEKILMKLVGEEELLEFCR